MRTKKPYELKKNVRKKCKKNHGNLKKIISIFEKNIMGISKNIFVKTKKII